jgi:thymidylate synthase
MASIDITYYSHLHDIVKRGYTYEDPNRAGVIRTELPSVSIRHELSHGFPVLTLKKTFFKGAVAELLFFLSGSTDIRDLWRRKVNFWDKDWARFKEFDDDRRKVIKNEWIKEGYASGGVADFDMGRIYPAQYRNFNGRVDQFSKVVKTLKENPLSTYMVVNAWNPDELGKMALAPCHYGFQILGRPLGDGKFGFEIHWQQRSTDYFLGTPINIQYYALMAILLEQITGHKALAVVGDMKKVHLYDNQIEQAKEVLSRRPTEYGDIEVELSAYLKRVKEEGHYDGTNLDEILQGIEVGDFSIPDYESFPPLKAEMLTQDSK